MRRALFEAVGGFPELALMEDIELCAPAQAYAASQSARARAHLRKTLGAAWRMAHHRADVAPALGLLARRARRAPG